MEVKVEAANDSLAFEDLNVSPDLLNEGIAVYELDEVTGYLQAAYLSRGAKTILGIDQDLSLPCTLSALGLFADDEESYELKLKETFVSGKTFSLVQQLAKRQSETDQERRFYRQVTVTPVKGADDGKVRLIEISQDISLQSSVLRELTHYNTRLLMCLQQNSQRIWELDLGTRKFSLFDPNQGALGGIRHTMSFPNELIDKGFVHPDSLSNFRILVRKILGGEKYGGGAFILKSFSGQGYSWFSVSFRMLFGHDGIPYKAIGVLTSLDSISALPRIAEYSRVWEYLLPSLYGYCQVNLSKDRVEKMWFAGKNLSYTMTSLSYTELIEYATQKIFSYKDRTIIQEKFSCERLLELAQEGRHWLCENLNVVESDAYVNNLTMHVLLVKGDPAQGEDIHAFIYLQHAQKSHLSDPDLTESRVHDEITCTFSAADAEDMIVKHLKRTSTQNAHAVVRVCNTGNRTDSPQLFNFIAACFSLFFESNGIVSLMPKRTISIFLPDCDSVIKARQLLENSFLFARKMLAQSSVASLRFASVLTQGELQSQYFGQFNTEAVRICTRLESKPADAIEYMSPFSEIKSQRNLQGIFTNTPSSVQYSEIENKLNDEEKQILFECLDIIITSQNAGSCVRKVFSMIGRYYQADRVYCLRIINAAGNIEEMGEWDAESKINFKGLIGGMTLDKFQLLNNAVSKQKAVFVKNINRALNTGLSKDDKWGYAALPLLSDTGDFKGVLCIDNPALHQGRLALPEALKAYLILLLKKMLKERYDFVSLSDMSPKVYNISAYMEQIGRLSSDNYNSMGAAVFACPKILLLENEYGTEHCLGMLSFLNNLLRRCFGNSLIFNTYHHEFAVLVPNTTKEVFFERVSRVQQLCRRNYPGQISSGGTWSRSVFTGLSLVKEARTIMLMQQASLNPKITYYESNDYSPLTSSLLKNFTVYFQPKIDMHSGKLTGAEALVRGIDENGAIVPPVCFISAMEKKGTLRDLDLFVFSRVLWQIKNWRSRGYATVPVSVNFSRFTIFDSSTAGAVLAILSNYDPSAANDIEIEITETACAVEDETLNRTLSPYRNLGIRFALDDFGTGYANLSIFSKVRFDTIKLDRSLINDLSVNSVSRSLLESITRISNERKIDVVAEGVEYDEQVKILMQRGCHIAQGFLYDKPLDAESFTNKYLALNSSQEEQEAG